MSAPRIAAALALPGLTAVTSDADCSYRGRSPDAARPGNYANPIRSGGYPDPSVLRVLAAPSRNKKAPPGH